MKIKIIAVGKLKEKYFADASEEYVKRLSRFASAEVIEVEECFFQGIPNLRETQKILEAEGKKLLEKAEGYVVALDIEGTQLSSESFAEKLIKQKQYFSAFSFIVGGSYGLSDEVKHRANLRFSLGKVTLPHQLARVVLTEQLYRACTIENNISYHK